VGERGAAEVTAATTTSAASTHRTSTGRTLEALWVVYGMSASQNSPAWGGIVQSFVLRGASIQEGAGPPRRTRRGRGRNRLDGDPPSSRPNCVNELGGKRQPFSGT